MARYLVFNSKGGCGKSLITREVIAGPKAAEFVIAEIDPLNRTQEPYKDKFKDVIQLDAKRIEELMIHLCEHDHVVADVGVDNLSASIQKLVDYSIFDDIDHVIIPMQPGRSDEENALKTYVTVNKFCKRITFVFNRADEADKIENNFPVFFQNVGDFVKGFGPKNYVVIKESEIFAEAQEAKKLVVELAEDVDHKTPALEARDAGDIPKFRELMGLELKKKASQILVEKSIMPAHKKLVG